MGEWKIIESDQFSDLPLDDSQRPALRWRWMFLVGGVLVFLSAVGLLTLQARRTEGRMTTEDDLAAFIFEEEALQFLGREEQAATMIIPTAPQEWQERYRQLFRSDRDEPPEGSLQLTKIEFDGKCATVDLEREVSKWVAAYCLVDQQWRRAPVRPGAWGDKSEPIEIIDGVELHFRPRDQVFAEALATDLREFLVNLELWGFYSKPAVTAAAESNHTFEIIIEPRDLNRALIAAEDRRLVVNSPGLIPTSGALNGSAEVRLVVARTIQRLSGPDIELSDLPLPGAAIFLEASQTVVAARSMLPADKHRSLTASWRSQLDGHWIPPLYAKLIFPDQPLVARRAEMAAHLMADHIFVTYGPATVKLIIDRIPQARSWDRLFQSTVGRSMIELESEAATYARADWDSYSPHRSNGEMFSIAAKLIRFDGLKDGRRAYVTVSDQLDPIVVDIPLPVHFVTTNQQVIPPVCLTPGTRMLIEGEWLEVRRRLLATRISLEEIIPTDLGLCMVSFFVGD